MSFLSSVKSLAIEAVESTKRGIQHLQATPQVVWCPTCSVNVPVPVQIWEWKCANGHSNSRQSKACMDLQCTQLRPSTLPTPTMSCTTCNTRITIPNSNFSAHIHSVARTTAEVASSAVTVTKNQVAYLRAIPQQFHCTHCDSLLAVPTGPWACQTCTAVNDEHLIKCRSCQQAKTEQKAICGVCRQSTKIPSSNLLDSLAHSVRDAHKSSQKIYYDLSGKPYVSCTRCNAHIKIVKKQTPASIELEHKEGIPTNSSSTTSTTATTSSTSSSSHIISATEPGAHDHDLTEHELSEDPIICPACRNVVELE